MKALYRTNVILGSALVCRPPFSWQNGRKDCRELIVIDRPSAALALVMLSLAPPLAAKEPEAPTWTQEKCARYKAAWMNLLARRGTQGLGPDFLASHEAFLASGCTAKAEVCPRSGPELDVANILVIAAMNAGTASTFLPFACRKS